MDHTKNALEVAMLMLGLGCVNLARADQIFVTPSGSTEPDNGELVSAMADFSLSGNTLTITLTNTLPGIHDAAQLLTDIFFTLSVQASPTLSSQTGDLISVDKNGVITDLGSSALGWGFGAATVNSMSGFEACVICQGGPAASATPSEGIIGPASGDGKYDNANASIDGNKPHNPFVNQTATFVLTDIPADATVGNVIFPSRPLQVTTFRADRSLSRPRRSSLAPVLAHLAWRCGPGRSNRNIPDSRIATEGHPSGLTFRFWWRWHVGSSAPRPVGHCISSPFLLEASNRPEGGHQNRPTDCLSHAM